MTSHEQYVDAATKSSQTRQQVIMRQGIVAGEKSRRSADPTRRAILARLASGEASVTELAKPFAMSQPAISKHLRVLETRGLEFGVAVTHNADRAARGQPLAEAYAGGWRATAVLGDRRLAHCERLGQLCHRRLAGGETRQDRPPRWVGASPRFLACYNSLPHNDLLPSLRNFWSRINVLLV